MSDYTLTPNLGLYLPTYDADEEQWGFHINDNSVKLDAAFSPTSGVFLPLAGGAMGGPVALAGISTAPLAVPGTSTSQIASTAFVSAAVTGLLTDAPTDGQYYGRASSVWQPVLPLSGGTVSGSLRVNGTIGFNNTAPIAKPTISGACAGNTAIKALLTALAAYGLVVDSTTA